MYHLSDLLGGAQRGASDSSSLPRIARPTPVRRPTSAASLSMVSTPSTGSLREFVAATEAAGLTWVGEPPPGHTRASTL